MMRFRPRFSVRTLAILVTLACAYFGAWEATKKWGVTNVAQKPQADPYERDLEVWSPAPLIIVRDKLNVFLPEPASRKVYLWLFGAKIKLPFEWEWKGPYFLPDDIQFFTNEDPEIGMEP